ncbi:MAG: AmmeMemoRadiSam system protein A [Caldiserica bacterium]|nr:AmmeMemoRadiSam system protein A [Caldisericota bacterium]
MSMSEHERLQLLSLARESIRMRLLDARELGPTRQEFPDDKFWQDQGVFVTLTEHGDLRGCIGTIMPVSPLVQAVSSNALSAAFGDPRFEPVEEVEFADLCIEVSLLSVPAVLAFVSLEDLETRLGATHPGVILQRGIHQATFLPQVWEQLPNVHGFLEALCHKAGLSTASLSQPGLSVFTYEVEAFSEDCS